MTVLCLLSFVAGQASLDPPAIAPPDFSGASGFYSIETRALPTEIEIHKPLILIVTIKGDGPKNHWPQRAKLKVISDEVKEDFFVSDFESHDRHFPTEKKWTFHYRLKPKGLDSKTIPALRFRFWYPKRQEFVLRKSAPIPITVKPAPALKPPPDAVQRVQAPAYLLELSDAEAALERVEPPSMPHWSLIVLVLAAPPVLACVWFWLWKRHHPEAALLRQRQRNRAARQALHRLQRSGIGVDDVVAAFADYLRTRIGIVAQEATADEVLDRLKRLGAKSDLRTRFMSFYTECDDARFSGRNGETVGELRTAAVGLIEDLEADSCLDVKRGY